MATRPYSAVQERTTEIEAADLQLAKKAADIRFGAYQIQVHPDVKEGPIHIRETLYENLPMFLNLAESKTVIGRAEVHRDLESGKFSIVIEMRDDEALLMDHLVEICDLRAIGFAGYLKENLVDGSSRTG